MRSHKFVRQTGATLLEVLSFLGIASLILVGAIALFGSAQSTTSADQILREASAIQSGVRTVYGHQPDVWLGGVIYYRGNTELARAGIIPDSLNVDLATGTITSKTGANVYIYGMPSSYFLAYDGIPKSVCMKVATRAGKNYKAFEIGWSGMYYTDSGPMSMDEAVQRCSNVSNIKFYL